MKRLQLMNETAFDMAIQAVKKGKQAMVFVHSRCDFARLLHTLTQYRRQPPCALGTCSSTSTQPPLPVDCSAIFSKDTTNTAREFRQLAQKRGLVSVLCPHTSVLGGDDAGTVLTILPRHHLRFSNVAV
jgi:hypothetical protein